MTAGGLDLFRGEVAIVTGAAGRIGRAIAGLLAGEGATVHLVERDTDRLGALARELVDEGAQATATVLDLADRAATDDFCRGFLDRHGPAHMVVHAACPPVLATTGPDVDDATWDAMFEVGVGAARRLAGHFAPAMRQAGIRGRFLLLTSLHAETPRNFAHYSGTKAAMTMLMKELARSLGPSGIRVNALAPGHVPDRPPATPPTRIPLGRSGTGEDMARMAAVLLSDRFSAYVTGTTVVVDGGLSLSNWLPRQP